jgi:lysozyme
VENDLQPGTVVDLSHFNLNPDFAVAKANGITAVIHKATQGATYVDPAYSTHSKAAAAAGLLWGAYHFGTGAESISQAGLFLKIVEPSPATLVVLDLELNPTGPSMTLPQAAVFVSHIQEATGRWPGLYGGDYLKSLLGASADPVLRNCWFWLSQYGNTPVVPPAWQTWTLWQYTGSATVPGLGRCDRSRFNNSLGDLTRFWTPTLNPPASTQESPGF